MGGGACIPTALDFRIGSTSCVMRYPEGRFRHEPDVAQPAAMCSPSWAGAG